MHDKKQEPTDKERALIEATAKKIVESDFEFFALILLQTIKPVVYIGGELAYFLLAPFLPLLNEKGYEFIDTYEKRENIEMLIKRVEELSTEKEKPKSLGLWSRFRQSLSKASKSYK